MVGVLPDAVRLRPKAPLPTWPHHALATARGVPAWMDELAATPELGRWIDLGRLRQDLHAPGTLAPDQYQTAMRAIGLATWLRRQGLADPPQLSG
jgi:asparagine synthase (glutamine-hydrolysing)